jgi:hypothetical protein
MALINCHECGANVSTEAAACPSCGAKPKVPLAQRHFKLRHLFGVLLALFVGASLYHGGGSSSEKPGEQQSQPVNFDQPLETTPGAMVCPLSIAADLREGRGVKAAIASREEFFGRKEDAEKAGCEVWREGIPVVISSPDDIERAKALQAQGRCGMLSMGVAQFIYSCDLRNVKQ